MKWCEGLGFRRFGGLGLRWSGGLGLGVEV